MSIQFSSITRRRIDNFKKNSRGMWSFRIFFIIFIVSLFAELIANDKPILIKFDNQFFLPIFNFYPETFFGGEFETEADYRDDFVVQLIEKNGWMLWPPIHFSYDTVNLELPAPAPAPPNHINWLGSDDQGRDVLARLIYGFRISVLFGLTLTGISALLGITIGAIQGFLWWSN